MVSEETLEKVFDSSYRYYGCGLVFPPKLEGCRVLDLGSGSGRDVYILSSLVGNEGYVFGVDMTKEQVSQNLMSMIICYLYLARCCQAIY